MQLFAGCRTVTVRSRRLGSECGFGEEVDQLTRPNRRIRDLDIELGESVEHAVALLLEVTGSVAGG
jgi:hypothetical protein